MLGEHIDTALTRTDPEESVRILAEFADAHRAAAEREESPPC
ncbi:hypothetical protein PUR49_38035 [Streptomyces sp. BE147]|nr:hypothetical protein [Streptomyces sp. BE147]MEE1742280.1 hypothetical protein [Streptomyces sp. BE147]